MKLIFLISLVFSSNKDFFTLKKNRRDRKYKSYNEGAFESINFSFPKEETYKSLSENIYEEPRTSFYEEPRTSFYGESTSVYEEPRTSFYGEGRPLLPPRNNIKIDSGTKFSKIIKDLSNLRDELKSKYKLVFIGEKSEQEQVGKGQRGKKQKGKGQIGKFHGGTPQEGTPQEGTPQEGTPQEETLRSGQNGARFLIFKKDWPSYVVGELILKTETEEVIEDFKNGEII